MGNPITDFFGGTITQPYNPPQEYGVDVGLPVGQVVNLPVTGNYRPDLSTTYSSVFALPSGSYEDILHISPLPFGANQEVVAGTPIGSVSPTFGSGLYFPDISTGQKIGPFASSGPHIEVGLYSDPTQALYAGGSSAIDPTALFTDKSLSQSPNIAQQIANEIANGLQQATNNWPVVGAVTGRTSNPGSSTSSNPNPLGVNSTSNPFGLPNIPKDIGQRLGFILVAIALIIVGGLVIGKSFR